MAEIMMRKRKIVVLILLCAQGCAPIPKHELADMMTSSQIDRIAAEALESGDFTGGDWPEACWWKALKDPVLDQLIATALQESPTLKRAEERLRAATQFALQRRAKLFPEVYFEADDNWQHLAREGFFRAFAKTVPAVVNDVHLGLSFSYEFDFWGKNRLLFTAALGEAVALAAERMQAELILTTSIAYTYAELQFLLYKRQILEKMQAHKKAIWAIRTKREKNALDTSIRRLQGESDALDVQVSLAALDQEIRKGEHKLKALSGLGQEADLDISFRALPTLQVALPEKLSLDLMARRPDLVAQRARIESASKQIGAAKTDFYPNVDLMGVVGFETIHWRTLFRKENYSGNIDPAIHLPIFTAGRLRAHLREKVAQFDEAVYAYNEMILQAAQEVADRLTDMIQIQKQAEIREVLLQTAKKQETLVQHRLENGLSDQTAVLERQNQVLENDLMWAELVYGKQLAAVLLIRALGGGYHD
jgi:NodT family efflux transporter outer membrane factor (OMF) lipoprotein